MKTIALALATSALLASAHVSAQQSSDMPRIQVTAEHTAAVATGNLFASGELYSGTHFETVSTRTRDQVRAELRVAQQRGELAVGEHYPFVMDDAPGQGKTRAEVQAELAAYRLANPDVHYEN
ncbi:DUF4148 domain-containing protein [Pseudoduganella lutea]|uniref:DUF4148 domain-containing protein n=1 Tax=Pseudoduganella lutea TaxID=321985 RepID=A0A4P6KXS1_9BURK|nr:DUF4148 domain-containing protein [Pseudoduganella lutea]QBE63707.1 DUF4148 domain-containing protein [Pseudoduganella lutea]